MKEVIEITFKADGSVVLDGQGFEGTSCDAAMKEFEDALGTISKRVNKPDYHKKPQHKQQARR